MKLDIFRPSDFDSFVYINRDTQYLIDANDLVDHVHKILSERGRVVYGDDRVGGLAWFEQPRQDDTHQGILIGVREIEKECEHVNVWNYLESPNQKEPLYECQKCFKKLKAKWSVVE